MLNLTVMDEDGHDVDLDMYNVIDPASVGKNPDAYTVQPNGTNATAWYKWENVNSTVNVTHPYNVTSGARDLSEYRIYGTLTGASDYDLYRITHTSGTWLNITVTSRNGTDVDFFLQNATDPSILGNDPDNYTVKQNDTSTTHWYRWNNVTSGEVFSLLIRHKVSGTTAYSVTYARETGGDPPPPPQQDCENPVGDDTIEVGLQTCQFHSQ